MCKNLEDEIKEKQLLGEFKTFLLLGNRLWVNSPLYKHVVESIFPEAEMLSGLENSPKLRKHAHKQSELFDSFGCDESKKEDVIDKK